MRTRLVVLSAVLALALGACDPVSVEPDAADADLADAAGDGGIDPDAPDGAVAPPSPRGQELTTAGGRLVGPTFTLDVQLGHATAQAAIESSTYSLEPNTPIKP